MFPLKRETDMEQTGSGNQKYTRSHLMELTEKAMAPHSSTPAWKIPRTEEPGKAAVHGVVKRRTQLSDFTFTFHFHALEKEMATHSSVLAWRIPGTGEPGGLPSLGSHRVGHHWSDLAAAIAAMQLNGFQHQSVALASSKMESKIYPRIPFVSRPQECQFRYNSGVVVKNLLASAEDTGDVG